ncbi:hypothetical protein [Phaeovulum sp. NW3]|uniref:hypothetical protein n=1 Tax=Phaeovulum sp. NW3 TaxID=2934933 RepID=UPI0020226AF5|nr:hypothetical protein [Phaeovulum sp. NW3]MCL7464700.1 hypothetical protein [Phaeovulum sp. NW3]
MTPDPHSTGLRPADAPPGPRRGCATDGIRRTTLRRIVIGGCLLVWLGILGVFVV